MLFRSAVKKLQGRPLWQASSLVCVGLFLLLPVLLLAQTQKNNSASGLPSPTPAEQDYRIHKGDKLSVKFLYQPELSDAAVVVRPDGKISLSMIPELKAEGLTVKELKAVVEKAYAEILLAPEINITLVEFVPQRVFVGGQVTKPGSYDLRAGQTLLQAVILAGGFTPDAHRKMVLLARPVNERELKVEAIDLTKLLKPGAGQPEIFLQDGDYVFVPNSKLSKMTSIISAFRAFVPGYGLQF